VLLRQIHAVQGDATVRVLLDPRAGFGRQRLYDLHRTGGIWTGRTGGMYLRWSGGEAIGPDDGVLLGTIDVPAGRHHDLVLELGTAPPSGPPPEPAETWRTTLHTWRSGNPRLQGCLAHRDAVHAHTVLRGMTYPGGGTVAAATTSLPERARAGRNYDYRYAWIRDQCIIGQAAAAAGADDLLDAAVGFVAGRLLADGPATAPAYTVTGGPVPEQQPLAFLPGYPGGEVRTGNWARGQFQLDALGEAMLLLAAAARRDRLDDGIWHAAEVAADAIRQRWREPDSGIWELEPRQWTESKLACVAGLRAAARVAPAGQAAGWLDLADRITVGCNADGLHPSGRW